MRQRTGLQEPLLQDRRQGGNTVNANANATDVEAGTINIPSNNPYEQSSDTEDIPLLQQKYRSTAMLFVVLDLIITVTVACILEGKAAFFSLHHPYDFGTSVIDIVWLTLARTLFLMYQLSHCVSLRATKIAGYASLLSLLFMIIKACCATGFLEWHDKPHLYAVLLIASFNSCANECILELLVGIHSSKDLSVTVAPSENEAARGIAVEEAKSIGIGELLKVLKPYFWPEGLLNRICVFMTWIFLSFSKASNIMAPLCIAKATDELTSNNIKSATKHIFIYATLLLSNKVFKECQSMAYIRVKLIAGVQLKERIFSHLLSLSMDWHQRKSMGAVVTAMERGINASNAVVQYLFLYLLPTFFEAVIIAIVFVKTFGAPLLAAIAICGCTLYICVTIELTLFRMQFRKRMNKADNDASHKVSDALLNIETVKYFAAEEHEMQRYRESVDIFQASAYKIQGSLSILNSSQQIVLNSTLVAALIVAAHEYSNGDFTIGKFVAVNVYIMQLFAPLNFLGSIYSMAVGSYVDLQNLCNLLAEKLDVEDRENAHALTVAPNTPLEIEFRNVYFAYPSRTEVDVLRGVSFKIPAGAITGIVGSTGAGKSTLTRLLFRFFEANQGEVLVGGENVLGITQKSLRSNLGVVPQDHILFNDTLEYNIRYGARDSNIEAVHDAIRSAELEDFVNGLPKGLETVVGERGQQVSGGQKQRVAIARVLMKDCPICILDEATSSLDSRTESQIQKSLECLNGRTMLIIAHRLSTIQHADQIIVMSSGQVLESGSHEALLAKGTWHEECYASLWDKQQKAD